MTLIWLVICILQNAHVYVMTSTANYMSNGNIKSNTTCHILYIMHHTSYTIHSTKYAIHYILCKIYYIQYTKHNKPYKIHHIQNIVHYMLYIVYQTQYTICGNYVAWLEKPFIVNMLCDCLSPIFFTFGHHFTSTSTVVVWMSGSKATPVASL